MTLIATIAALVGFVTFSAAASAAQTPTQTVNVNLSGSLTHLTTGGPFTFVQSSPTFNQFDPALGTLIGTTLSWNITGSENGVGDFAGTGTFSYAGQSQVVTFDTKSDPGPKSFNFTGSQAYTGAVTGTGTFAPSTFTGVIQQSGYFPWDGSMSATGTVSITYQYTPVGTDVTPPSLSNVPTNISTQATGPNGATATYTAPTATDDVGVTSQGCTPASGSVFPLGLTTVHCTASDAAGNVGTASFTVTVIDSTAPTLSNVPANITAEATGPNGATATYTAPTATDDVGVTSQGCTPASGSVFPLGLTTVHCTASDAAGNVGTASFTVTVADTTAPAYASTTNVALDASSPSGATVTYTVPTATDAVGVASNGCAPQSGTLFAIGVTTVTCNATDAAGNVGTTTFTVTVRSALQQLTSLQTQVSALHLSPTLGNSLQAKLATVQHALAVGDKAGACTALTDFINQVKAQSGKAIPKSQADALITTATRIKAVNGC